MLDGREKAAGAEAPAVGEASASAGAKVYTGAACPECRQQFDRVHPRQLFCSNAHKTTFHNRATVRGRMLTPIAMAARITRDGSRGDVGVGKLARRDAHRLMDLWAREDRLEGRMSMVDYMRERRRIDY